MLTIVTCLKEVRGIAKSNQIDTGEQLRRMIECYKIINTPITWSPEFCDIPVTQTQATAKTPARPKGDFRKGKKRTAAQRKNISRGLRLAWAKKKLAQIQSEQESRTKLLAG